MKLWTIEIGEQWLGISDECETGEQDQVISSCQHQPRPDQHLIDFNVQHSSVKLTQSSKFKFKDSSHKVSSLTSYRVHFILLIEKIEGENRGVVIGRKGEKWVFDAEESVHICSGRQCNVMEQLGCGVNNSRHSFSTFF